jgi:glutaredoxin
MNQEETIIVGVVILVLLLLLLRCYCTKVYRFYRPGCPYCVNSKEEWDLFKSKCTFKMTIPVDVNLDDNTEHIKKLTKRFNVNGVPTIVKTDYYGGYETYDGDRTCDSYLRWVNN